jgi:hypothetical protein
MARFERSQEVKAIAEELIASHHDHLSKARIAYLFADRGSKKLGKVLVGKATKASDLIAHFGQVDFIIVINRETWTALTIRQRDALVDHELCHCRMTITKTGEIRWWIRSHDVEEFSEIIERHGLWFPDLEKFVAASRQVELPIATR